MGLLRTALVFGAGYAFGHPDGRRKLTELSGQARQLTQRPEVVQLRERGWDTVSTKLKSARQGQSGGATGDTPVAGRRSWRPRPRPRHAAEPTTPVVPGPIDTATAADAVTPGAPITPATTAAPVGSGGTTSSTKPSSPA